MRVLGRGNLTGAQEAKRMASGVYRHDTERMRLQYLEQAIQSDRRDIAKIALLSAITLLLFTIAMWGINPSETRTLNADTPLVTGTGAEYTTKPPAGR